MRIGAFVADAIVEIDDQEYRLLWQTPSRDWQLEDKERRSIRTESEATLQHLYEQHRLRIIPGGPTRQNGGPSDYRSEPIEQMSINDQIRIKAKLRLLSAMRAREYRGWHGEVVVDGKQTSGFLIALAEVSRELGFPGTVSRAIYYKWRAALADADEDASALRARYRGRRQITEAVRLKILGTMGTIIARAQDASPREPFKPMTMAEIFTEVDQAIKDENAKVKMRNRLRSAAPLAFVEPELEIPRSRTTYWKYWRLFDADDRMMVTKGKRAAREAFRGGRGPRPAKEVLDRVEYDECQLPFMVYDEYAGIALGRPWLSWFIDVLSEVPIGLYLGFEEVSDLAICSAMRSACLPKTFLNTEYRIDRSYPVCGVPRTVTFDNPQSQHGQTVAAMADNLCSSYRFAPIATGWFKPLVEGSFNILNNTLLDLLPGFIMKGVSHRDYNPLKHGCLGFRALLELIWKWIVDLHTIDKHSRTGQRRIDVWNESVDRKKPGLLTDPRDLDVVFNVVRPAKPWSTLDHRGVIFESMRYHSDELQDLRRRHGSNLRAQVRINPADLEFVLVRYDRNDIWARARAIDWEYARGRSLRQHLECKKYAKSKFGSDSIDDLQHALFSLNALISESVLVAQTISTNTLLAKTWGLGSNHVTAALDLAGNLGPVGGPFLGHSIGPMRMENIVGPAAGIIPAAAAPKLITSAAHPIPKFIGDLSLGGSKP